MGFIVIEGLDGSGKSTQVKLLKEYFDLQSLQTKYIHFPTNNSEIFGELISKFLRGEFGALSEVNPYLVALIFAGDRYNLAPTINDWLSNEIHVINDRYVYSNIAYQCAKCIDKTEAEKLFDWILNLEYSYFKIPEPDLNIFLDVPFSFTKERLLGQRQGEDRKYLKGKTDIHESNLDFQRKVREFYLKAVVTGKNFVSVKCYDEKEQMLSPEKISEMIIEKVREFKII